MRLPALLPAVPRQPPALAQLLFGEGLRPAKDCTPPNEVSCFDARTGAHGCCTATTEYCFMGKCRPVDSDPKKHPLGPPPRAVITEFVTAHPFAYGPGGAHANPVCTSPTTLTCGSTCCNPDTQICVNGSCIRMI